MKSLVCVEPGKFEYIETNDPLKKEGQAIIKIRRVGICGTDLHAFEGTQPYFKYPRILGHEISGELTDVKGMPGFSIGEAVTFVPYFNCGICIACRNGKSNCCVNLKVAGVHVDGGMVEYLAVPRQSLIHGQGLSYDELALVEPLAIALHGVKRAAVLPGEFVLVIGAGPIGMGIMCFAALAGARVVALDTNKERLKFCKEKLNIREVIWAHEENVSERLMDITLGDMPGVVIDATGSLDAINNAFRYMAHGGRYVLVGLQKGDISFSHPEFHKREATLMSSRNATKADFKNVMHAISEKEIMPENFITHRAHFDSVKEEFSSWLDPASKVIKAMVSV